MFQWGLYFSRSSELGAAFVPIANLLLSHGVSVFLLSCEFFFPHLSTAAVLVRDLSPHTWVTTTVSWLSASRLFLPLRSLFHCQTNLPKALLSLLLRFLCSHSNAFLCTTSHPNYSSDAIPTFPTWFLVSQYKFDTRVSLPTNSHICQEIPSFVFRLLSLPSLFCPLKPLSLQQLSWASVSSTVSSFSHPY